MCDDISFVPNKVSMYTLVATLGTWQGRIQDFQGGCGPIYQSRSEKWRGGHIWCRGHPSPLDPPVHDTVSLPSGWLTIGALKQSPHGWPPVLPSWGQLWCSQSLLCRANKSIIYCSWYMVFKDYQTVEGIITYISQLPYIIYLAWLRYCIKSWK